jgi:hypothetical protein
MPVAFNPFNPMSYVNAWTSTVANTGMSLPRVAKGTPIPVELKNTDPGIKVAKKTVGDRVELSFSGTARGPAMVKPDNIWGDFYGAQPVSRTVSLGVAVAEAPTTDTFGRTNYTEKNHRSLVQSTKQGETGRAIAQDFANDINKNLLAFRAQVVPGSTPDSAKLIITRR